MKTEVLIFTLLCGIISSLYAADNNLCYTPSGAMEEQLRGRIENTQQVLTSAPIVLPLWILSMLLERCEKEGLGYAS